MTVIALGPEESGLHREVVSGAVGVVLLAPLLVLTDSLFGQLREDGTNLPNLWRRPGFDHPSLVAHQFSLRWLVMIRLPIALMTLTVTASPIAA